MVTPLVMGVVVLLRDGISVEHIGCKCECGVSWDRVIAIALSPSGTCCSSVVWISLERLLRSSSYNGLVLLGSCL